MEGIRQCELFKKIFEIQKLGLKFEKTAYNPFFKNKYCPLQKIREILSPELQKRDLFCYHSVENGNLDTYIVNMDDGRTCVKSSFKIESSDPQKVGATITYAKRYNLGAIFNIITDDDTDGGKPKAEKIDQPNLKKLKQFLNTKGFSKRKECEEYLSQQLDRIVSFENYTDEQAQKDLIYLMSNK